MYLNRRGKKSSVALVDDVVVGAAYSDSIFVQTMVLIPLEKGQKLTIQPADYVIFAVSG